MFDERFRDVPSFFGKGLESTSIERDNYFLEIRNRSNVRMDGSITGNEHTNKEHLSTGVCQTASRTPRSSARANSGENTCADKQTDVHHQGCSICGRYPSTYRAPDFHFNQRSHLKPEAAECSVSLKLGYDMGRRRSGTSLNSPPSIVIVCPMKRGQSARSKYDPRGTSTFRRWARGGKQLTRQEF